MQNLIGNGIVAEPYDIVFKDRKDFHLRNARPAFYIIEKITMKISNFSQADKKS